MENSTNNILVAGVGGQGVILASDIMSEVFMKAGYDVKKSEVHGMAMRGGPTPAAADADKAWRG